MARLQSKKLTQGVIWKQLIIFALPIFLSSVFQQLYNTVDSAIVGQVLGTQAFAAVSSASHVVNIVIAFFVGISTGAGIVIAQFFGAGEEENLQKAVHTAMLLSLLAGVVLTFLGVWVAPYIVAWTKTPYDIVPYLIPYLKVYFIGTLPMLIYNLGSGLLRAVGDSQRPFWFLVASSVVNILLDYLFVVILGFGVTSAAWATTISQVLSAILVLITFTKTKQVYRMRWSKLRIHGAILKEIVRVGLPAGVQSTISTFAHLLMNTKTNMLGTIAVAGVGAVMKIDNLVFLSIEAVGLATTTFVAQNFGARMPQRARRSIRVSIVLTLAMAFVLTVAVYLLRYPLIHLFVDDQDTVACALTVLYCILPGYVLFAPANTLSCALRGGGASVAPMAINLFCYCVLRMFLMWVIMPLWPDVRLVALCYPISWALAIVLSVAYYYHGRWAKRWEPDQSLTQKP